MFQKSTRTVYKYDQGGLSFFVVVPVEVLKEWNHTQTFGTGYSQRTPKSLKKMSKSESRYCCL